MNTDSDTYLQNIMDSAQMEMPAGLKGKLLAIGQPQTASLWREIARVLPQLLVGLVLAVQAFPALPVLLRPLKGLLETVPAPTAAIWGAALTLWNQALQGWTGWLSLAQVPQELALAYFLLFIMAVASAIIGALLLWLERQATIFVAPRSLTSPLT